MKVKPITAAINSIYPRPANNGFYEVWQHMFDNERKEPIMQKEINLDGSPKDAERIMDFAISSFEANPMKDSAYVFRYLTKSDQARAVQHKLSKDC